VPPTFLFGRFLGGYGPEGDTLDGEIRFAGPQLPVAPSAGWVYLFRVISFFGTPAPEGATHRSPSRFLGGSGPG